MALSEVENFTIELCDTIPVQMKQEVGRYPCPEHSREMMICFQCRSSPAIQEPKYIKFEYEGEDSQPNDDQYFQQEVVEENYESKQEVDMYMSNELPISQTQEILYLEDPPLQTDEEGMRESANMDPTEHGGNSPAEENNIQRPEQSPATGRTTRKKKRKNSQEKQAEETSGQNSGRYVGTRRKKKTSEEPERKEDARRIKRPRKGKKSRFSSSTPSEDEKQADVYKEYPLLLPKRRWSTTQRLNLYSKPDVISLIKNTLNERQLDKLRRSCFGNFLDFKITKFSSQLFYHLIRRQCSSKNPNELWFNLEGRVHKFGIKEFALITGMNCGELPAIDMSKIRRAWFSKRYFGGERTIKRTKLHEIFVEMDKGRDKDVVKMAKLYILEMFLLGKQITTGITHEYTLLIDDKEQFERYPWGRVSYEITIDFVKKAIKSNDASAIGVGGFPYALLVWAYETISLLSINSNFFATKISSSMPRMNNWVADVHPEWKDLSEKIFQSDSFDVQPMVATDAELGMRYMLTFGGVEQLKDKSKSPLDREQNNDARTSYNKDHKDWGGPKFVSNDGVLNILLSKIVNLEKNMEKIAYDMDVIKNLIYKIMENGKRSC